MNFRIYYAILLFTMLSTLAFSQNTNDTIASVSKKDDIKIQISLDDINKIQAENNSLKEELAFLKESHQENLKKSNEAETKISILEKETNDLKADTTLLHSKNRESQKQIATLEAEIKKLIEKHKNRKQLLLSYQKDIKELLDFIKELNTALNKTKDKRFPNKQDAEALKAKLKSKELYKKYVPDLKDTYLGKKLSTIEKQLDEFNGMEKKLNLTDIQNELNKCLETID